MNIALILSGGKGIRLKSDIPKQYISVGGRMILTSAAVNFFSNALIDAVWLVADSTWHSAIREDFENNIDKELLKKLKGFSLPGTTRQLSILNGLQDMQKSIDIAEEDIVLVTDAVRACVSEQLIGLCVETAGKDEYDGAMPVLPMKDTVYISEDGRNISSLIDRSTVFAGQAPEAFRYGKYLRANEVLLPDKILTINGSSEPAVLSDMRIAMVDGDENNFKITTIADLERYKEIQKI